MFQKKVILDSFVMCIILLLATTMPAYAYIDPGTGSLIWQFIISAFAGTVFFFRKSIYAALGIFKKHSNDRQ